VHPRPAHPFAARSRHTGRQPPIPPRLNISSCLHGLRTLAPSPRPPVLVVLCPRAPCPLEGDTTCDTLRYWALGFTCSGLAGSSICARTSTLARPSHPNSTHPARGTTTHRLCGALRLVLQHVWHLDLTPLSSLRQHTHTHTHPSTLPLPS
jgi:hypothetical protein